MSSFAQKKKTGRVGNEYVVLASKAVQQDAAWMQVVNALKEKHGAEVFFYEKAPRENLGDLQRVKPRYVALVEIFLPISFGVLLRGMMQPER